MCAADVAAGEEQVRDVARVEAAVRDAERARAVGVLGAGAVVPEALRVVVVDLPAAVGDDVREVAAGLHLALREHVVAEVASALALAGERADPLESEVAVLLPLLALVLDPVPHAVGDREELVAVPLRVADRVVRAADLDPPVVVVRRVGAAVEDPAPHVRRGEVDRPRRRREVLRRLELHRLQEDRVAHRAGVGLGRRLALAVFGARLAADAVVGAGERREDGVAGAVGEEARGDLDPALRRALPRADGADRAVLRRLARADRGVEQERQVRLAAGEAPEDGVEDGPARARVVAQVLELDLLEEARLATVRPVRAADMHADLAAGVAAEHRAVLDEDRLGAVARRGERGAEACDAAAHDAEVGRKPLGWVLHGRGF